MASLAELARFFTRLHPAAVAHLQRLVGSWGLLADFCFADLLLYVPQECATPEKFVVVGQMRPATSQTVYRRDWFGTVLDSGERPVVATAYGRGEIVEATVAIPDLKEQVRVLAIP